MPIDIISQTISTIPEAGHRGVDVQTQFVIKQEDFQDHLQGTTVSELNALKTQINTTVTGMNTAVTTVNTEASQASTSASSASTSANTATTKASQASASASSASTSATKASQWADNNYNVEVETGKYSAKHWSTVAQNTVNDKVDKVTSTDNAVVRFDGTTGLVQNSGVIIDDAGNVGIGVAPSAWGSVWKSLDLLASSITSHTTLTDPYTIISNNAYISGSSSTLSSVYKNNGSANLYSQGGGVHLWKIAPSGTAGNAITWTNAMILDASGNLLLTSGTGGLGYGPGSGGIVTQLTSKATAVTLNKPTGQITMNNSALAAGASVEFILNNTSIITYSIIMVNPVWNNSNYKTEIVLNTTGAVIIRVTNMSGSSLSDSLVVRFSVLSGAVS